MCWSDGGADFKQKAVCRVYLELQSSHFTHIEFTIDTGANLRVRERKGLDEHAKTVRGTKSAGARKSEVTTKNTSNAMGECTLVLLG